MTALRTLGLEAARMLRFLKSLTDEDRAERLTVLLRLDGDRRALSPVLTVQSTGVTVSWKRPIVVTPSYVDFATSSIARIKLYARTGSTKSAVEATDEVTRSSERRAFYEGPVYTAAREAVRAKVKDPRRIVETASVLWEAMYERLGGPAQEQDDLGYWADRISINLVKLGRINEALRWIDRFEALPESVKARTSPSVRDAIHKRKLRGNNEPGVSA